MVQRLLKPEMEENRMLPTRGGGCCAAAAGGGVSEAVSEADGIVWEIPESGAGFAPLRP
jgi:hypothetical protein